MILVPGTPNNQIYIDVWLSNNFPCKDLVHHPGLLKATEIPANHPTTKLFATQARLTGLKHLQAPGEMGN